MYLASIIIVIALLFRMSWDNFGKLDYIYYGINTIILIICFVRLIVNKGSILLSTCLYVFLPWFYYTNKYELKGWLYLCIPIVLYNAYGYANKTSEKRTTILLLSFCVILPWLDTDIAVESILIVAFAVLYRICRFPTRKSKVQGGLLIVLSGIYYCLTCLFRIYYGNMEFVSHEYYTSVRTNSIPFITMILPINTHRNSLFVKITNSYETIWTVRDWNNSTVYALGIIGTIGLVISVVKLFKKNYIDSVEHYFVISGFAALLMGMPYSLNVFIAFFTNGRIYDFRGYFLVVAFSVILVVGKKMDLLFERIHNKYLTFLLSLVIILADVYDKTSQMW